MTMQKIDVVFVESLLAGSDNLNFMRKKIHRCVSTVLGFASDEIDAMNIARGLPKVFHATKGNWELRMWRSFVSVHYYYGLGRQELCCWDSYHKEPLSLHDASVEIIYDDLPAFVEGMRNLFPSLEQRWEHLLRASKKKFD